MVIDCLLGRCDRFECAYVGDAVARALLFALSAAYAEFGIDVGYEVGYLDCSVGAYPLTFAAAYTAYGALFHGERAFVAVHAAYPDYRLVGLHRYQLEERARACLDAFAASGALIMVYYSYAADGVDVQGIEYAGIDAVAAPQTSIVAIGLSLIESAFHCAGSDAVVIIYNLALFAAALTFHYGHALYSGFSFKADDYRNILHNLFAGTGAVEAVE